MHILYLEITQWKISGLEIDLKLIVTHVREGGLVLASVKSTSAIVGCRQLFLLFLFTPYLYFHSRLYLYFVQLLPFVLSIFILLLNTNSYSRCYYIITCFYIYSWSHGTITYSISTNTFYYICCGMFKCSDYKPASLEFVISLVPFLKLNTSNFS